MIIAKVHGVFPSRNTKSASSRIVQFHWIYSRDSGKVVTPFMRVVTYTTRNFATLGPSGLQPPFTRSYRKKEASLIANLPISITRTGQVSPTIHRVFHLAVGCVFDKQSLSPIMCRQYNRNSIPTISVVFFLL